VPEYEAEVESRLGRPFAEVRLQLEELFDQDWDEVVVIVETSATKTGRTWSEVIVDLVGRSERKPPPKARLKRSLVRWIGKPWRERDNPWDRFKDKVPPAPGREEPETGDLDEWTPLRPDD
jgi:hypothetical protein